MTSTTEKIGAAVAWNMASRVGRMALGIVTSAMVVRGLGDHDYGVLSLVRSILMFVVLLSGVGTGQAVLKFLPELRVARSSHAARRLVRRVFVTHAAAWVIMLAVAFAWRGGVERLFHSDGVGVYVVVAVALACFEIGFTVASHVLNASYDAARLAVAALVSHAVYALGLWIALQAGGGIVGVLAAAAAGNAVALVMVGSRVRAAAAFAGPPAATPIAESVQALSPARVWRYSLPFAAIGVLNLVVWRQSETILLAHFRSAEETGYFDVAYRLPQMVLEFVPGTVWPLVMAGMSEAFARDRESLRRVVGKYYRMLFALCAPLCAGGAIAGGRVVEVLYGEAMRPAAVPTQIFFLVFTVSFLATPLSMALYVLEKTHVNLLIYALLAVINVGLDLVLIPKYGVYGAIVPVAIAIVLQPILYYHATRRYHGALVIPTAYIARCFLGAASALVMVPVLAVLGGASGLLVAAVVGTAAIIAGYRWARVLGGEELALLARAPLPGAARLAAALGASTPRGASSA